MIPLTDSDTDLTPSIIFRRSSSAFDASFSFSIGKQNPEPDLAYIAPISDPRRLDGERYASPHVIDVVILQSIGFGESRTRNPITSTHSANHERSSEHWSTVYCVPGRSVPGAHVASP